MRKIKFIIFTLLILVVIFSLSNNAFACNLSIISDKNEVNVGEDISVTIDRVKTHKTCVLPIEETEIEIINGEIVDEGNWIKGTKDTKEIVVKFTEPGTGIIKVIRDCPKGGLIVETKEFNVVNNNSTLNTEKENISNEKNSDILQKNNINESNSNDDTPKNDLEESDIEIINNETKNNTKSENLNSDNNISKEFQNYLFNPQTLLYIILIILSLIFISLKFYKLRFFTLLFSLIILGFYFGGCLCPVSYLGKLFEVEFLSIPFYIFLGLIIFISTVTIFKGRVFCGWVCPHGAIQEFLYKIKTKRFEKIEKYLKYMKYFILVIVLFLSFIYSKNYFCNIYPFKVLYNFSGVGAILIFLTLILIFSIFIYRPFCRFFCPFGAYLGIISKLSEKLGLNKNIISNECIKCKKCLKECNSKSIYEGDEFYKIDTKECFVCGDCKEICPKKSKC